MRTERKYQDWILSDFFSTRSSKLSLATIIFRVIRLMMGLVDSCSNSCLHCAILSWKLKTLFTFAFLRHRPISFMRNLAFLATALIALFCYLESFRNLYIYHCNSTLLCTHKTLHSWVNAFLFWHKFSIFSYHAHCVTSCPLLHRRRK